MKFKQIEQAKQTWRSLKDTQKVLMFNAIWNGEIIPGMPLEVRHQINKMLSKIGGKPPGLIYKETIDAVKILIKNFKKHKYDEAQIKKVKELIKNAYPVKSRLTRKITLEEQLFNQKVINDTNDALESMRTKIFENKYLSILENSLLTDLIESQERDKIKIMQKL